MVISLSTIKINSGTILGDSKSGGHTGVPYEQNLLFNEVRCWDSWDLFLICHYEMVWGGGLPLKSIFMFCSKWLPGHHLNIQRFQLREKQREKLAHEHFVQKLKY